MQTTIMKKKYDFIIPYFCIDAVQFQKMKPHSKMV